MISDGQDLFQGEKSSVFSDGAVINIFVFRSMEIVNRGVVISYLFGIFLFLFCSVPMDARAEIASDNAFEGAVWEKIIEDDIEGESGIVQSVCVTEDYIICLENSSDTSKDLDIIRAYYRNDTDEDGNPVERYSLAKHVENLEYEHANGMAYNPKTREILVALYINSSAENRGAIYRVDADTFTLKGKVKISDDYNVLGIGYDEENDRYVIQTNVEDGYSFKILDSQFRVTEDLGEYEDTCVGYNFQDLCVSGDYIINFPLTLNMGIGDYIQMYSISRKKMVSASKVTFPFENVASDEPESICELGAGVFAAVVNLEHTDGRRTFCIYKTVVPYNFSPSDVERDVKRQIKPDRGESKDAQETKESEVQNTEELQALQEDDGPDAVYSQEKQGGSRKGWIAGSFLLLLAAGIAGGIYARYVSVKRERQKKLERSRKEREQAGRHY